MSEDCQKDLESHEDCLPSGEMAYETQAANVYLKPAWAIALLEAKLGLEPSISEAKSAVRYVTIDTLFSPGEIKDAANGPSPQELENKIAQLKECQTLKKIATFRKELLKGVKAAKSHEIHRLTKRLKQVQSGEEGRIEDVAAIEKDLELTKSLNVEIFTDRLVSHTICKTKPLARHPHLQCFNLQDQSSHRSAFSLAEQDEFPCQKVAQRLTSSKMLANCVSMLKDSLLVYLGFREPLNLKDKPAKRMCTSGEAAKNEEHFPKKAKNNDARPKRNESVFITSLDGFEEDDEFKKLYGIKGKNRPGQRYRRKLNAQIYGQDATHLKAKKESKSVGFRPKTKPAPEEKLHPSWEAKRRQKLSIDLATIPKNNKIIFD